MVLRAQGLADMLALTGCREQILNVQRQHNFGAHSSPDAHYGNGMCDTAWYELHVTSAAVAPAWLVTTLFNYVSQQWELLASAFFFPGTRMLLGMC